MICNRSQKSIPRRGALFGAVIVFLLGAISPNAGAAAPQCFPTDGYCKYTGRVTRAFINASNEILLYFDTPLNLADASAAGITGVTNPHAAIYNMTGNKDFGKSLFAALLAAQARGGQVTVYMLSANAGYLMMDRIFVEE
jgi:hypothetical protein